MEPNHSTNGTTDPDRLAAPLIEDLPVTNRRLDLAGVSTSLLEGGEGPPIALLHGQGGFAEFMGGLIANLVDRHRVDNRPGVSCSVVRKRERLTHQAGRVFRTPSSWETKGASEAEILCLLLSLFNER